MKTVYLIRHTTPDVLPGTCYGISDPDVTDSFWAESEEIIRLIEKIPEKIYSSPLLRCSKLAVRLAGSSTIKYCDSLKEMNFGKWEMRNWNSISKNESSDFFDDFVNTSPPGGESFSQLNSRVTKFWADEIENSHQDSIIITHAGVLRSLLSHLLGLALERSFSIQLDYSSTIKCTQTAEKLYNIKFLKT